MSQARTDKVKLSFNAGQYSPFLDSRVDIDKAAAATREQRNVLSEVGGTARRRPGLRYVLTTTPGIGQPEELVNYVEFPLWYRMLYQSANPVANPDGTQGGPEFKGWVRYWENGVVEMWGKARYNHTATYTHTDPTYPFRMWIGSSETVGAASTVATLATDNTFYDVDWTGIPGPGEYVWLPYGNFLSSTPNRAIRMFEYAGGLAMPHVVYGPLTGAFATHAMKLSLSRSGNDLVLDGEMSAYEGGFGQPGVGTWLWTVDVSDANPVNWVETTFEIVDDLIGAFGAGDQYVEFTENRTLPDSDTLGYMYFALHNFAADIVSSVQIGPIFRSGRGPITLGSGTAPT